MSYQNILNRLKKKKVAVLKGGWSTERAISLRTGAAVEKAFHRLGIKAYGIDVHRNISETLLKMKIDFCFIALHGPFGEDGRIQSLLEILNIPYTGSGPLASGLAMDKDFSKKIFQQNEIPTPPWVTVRKSDDEKGPSALLEVQELFSKGPVFVKPVDQGSALGVSCVEKIADLPSALGASFKISDRAIIEHYISGRELTVGILGDTALPVVEIIPQHSFYDFHSKYAKGGSKHVVPANLPNSLTLKTQRLALEAFRALGCEVYGRVDLMMNSAEDLFVLEVNTIPGMTDTSLLPEAAQADGINFDELVIKIIDHSFMRNAPKK